jgi:hypothetical protein
MGLFGFGEDPSIPRAGMPSEYSSGFAKGQQFGFDELESARGVGEEQRRLAEALRAQAEGRTPSLAAMQYARALEQSQAAAASQLASARGLSPAMAQQLLMTQQAGARQAAAGKSAELRLQEQQMAQANLGTLLGQRRQGSLIGGQVAGGLGQQAGQLGLSQQQMEQQRLLAEQELRMRQQQNTERGIATGVGTVGGALIGGFLGGPAGAVAGASLGSRIGSGSGGAASKSELDALTLKAKGGEIKGRSKFNGDTRTNDTVPALLSPGEIVLPRSVAQSEDAPEKSKKFVEAIKSRKKTGKESLATALSRIQELESRINAMEALADLEAEERG